MEVFLLVEVAVYLVSAPTHVLELPVSTIRLSENILGQDINSEYANTYSWSPDYQPQPRKRTSIKFWEHSAGMKLTLAM